MKSLSVTNQIKATEQYFPKVLFITLYKVALTNKILKCHPSNENLRTILPFLHKLSQFLVRF